ncbi:MAG: lamin tail domain-containing protein, partial [Candidatus Omnitrophica bacterium]|nr:lamin tail domain-containing protein [Candidatus Omnitrophota bacterium]
MKSRILLACLFASSFLGHVTVHAQVPELVINEFMAVNSTTVADEDGDFSDWLEIHNSGVTPVDLAEWHLTDDAASPEKWTFPSVSVPAGGYLLVFASDKDRAVAGSELHLNFKLTSQGEYLGLIEPDGMTVAHEYAPAFPEQYEDVSYGLVSGVAAYMATPSPGAENVGGGLNQTSPVEFSVERGFHTSPFQVELSTQSFGATIRYTLDGSPPRDSHGTVYSGPVSISTSSVLRAAAFASGLSPSVIETQTYLFVADVVTQTYPGGSWPAPGTLGADNQVIDYDMDPDVTGDVRYSGVMQDALLSIPTLSLVTDLDNLFNTSTSSSVGG